MALTDKSSIVVPKGFYGKTNVLQGFNPQTENLVDLDVVRNTTATRVNEQGLIESVAANVPRRDFLNGGCGELLVEPQRTNLLTYSEQFDNANWGKNNTTVTTNATTAPDGATTADAISWNAVNGVHLLGQAVSFTSGKRYVAGYFLKKNTLDKVQLYNAGNAWVPINDRYANFDLTNGTVASNTFTDAGVIDYGNSWYFCYVIEDAPATSGGVIAISGIETLSDGYRPSFTGDGTSTLFVWGAQTEEGEYPTSYIPTTTAAVTRNQDVISASNIGSLLGDSEGGLFVEAAPFEVSTNLRFSLSDGSINNRVSITYFSSPQYFVVAGGVVQAGAPTSGTATANAFSKITLRYVTNDFAVYQDGSSVFTQGTGTTFSNGTLTDLRFDNGAGTANFYGRIRQLVAFDNAPTDTEMQTLTTP